LPKKANIPPSEFTDNFFCGHSTYAENQPAADKRRDFLFVAGRQQFIYDRYDKFADLEAEAWESLRG
jgi:hypothetical protein